MAEEIIPIPNLSLPQHLSHQRSGNFTTMQESSCSKESRQTKRHRIITRANHLIRIGDKEGAIAAQKLALEKTPGLGSRIDIVLTLIRLGFFLGDNGLIAENLPKAERRASFIEEGGDWDRRNHLKVYRGLHMISTRQLKAGSALLLRALSTFTATELTTYNDFIALTIIINGSLPHQRPLEDCHYAKIFVVLTTLEQTYLLPSQLLSPHTRYYVQEMRILAYKQLLESYRNLTLESLSGAFGVSVEFLDRHVLSARVSCSSLSFSSSELSRSFTATELTTYNDFVALTIIINALTLKQGDLDKCLITTPEVTSVLPEIPTLGDFLNNLYDCRYAKFFVALGSMIEASPCCQVEKRKYMASDDPQSNSRRMSGIQTAPLETDQKSEMIWIPSPVATTGLQDHSQVYGEQAAHDHGQVYGEQAAHAKRSSDPLDEVPIIMCKSLTNIGITKHHRVSILILFFLH
ncbi:hypothetical protein BDR05DRAFT_943305 [Suillus weaverae]|nr:hypothetical protein BDR05DRAFT_943305 [Suillus weaverae]